jgi:hypothetical protein
MVEGQSPKKIDQKKITSENPKSSLKKSTTTKVRYGNLDPKFYGPELILDSNSNKGREKRSRGARRDANSVNHE